MIFINKNFEIHNFHLCNQQIIIDPLHYIQFLKSQKLTGIVWSVYLTAREPIHGDLLTIVVVTTLEFRETIENSQQWKPTPPIPTSVINQHAPHINLSPDWFRSADSRLLIGRSMGCYSQDRLYRVCVCLFTALSFLYC